MERADLLPYVSHGLDDAGSPRQPSEAPDTARLVCWQAGFEPLCVAVWSYLPDVRVDLDAAEELATLYLAELGWFGDDEPQAADYVL